MKELSIEEKAKAYDEAIERAKKWYNAPNVDKIPTLGNRIIEEIFPELKEKESEGERIRKFLIGYFDELVDENSEWGLNQETRNKIVAWLEKQGEQKPVECCADKLWTEFQKQVAYLMASSYNREYEYTKGYVEWVAQSLLGYAKNEIEQKPAEWSDDDEAFLDDILCKVESNLLLNKDEKNWLKSLKDRYTWKPSDGQMKALKDALNDAICQYDFKGSLIKEEVTRKHAEKIESLYNDLKKLKG